MRDQSTAIADRPSAVVCNHPDDVAEVLAQPGYRLHVSFFDGTNGLVDLSALISSPNAGVFSALRDETLFAGVGIVLGAVTWPNGLDLAPDAMHSALSQNPEWRLTA
jgi:hypothetical protein